MNLSSTDVREIRKFGSIAFLFFGCLAALWIWRQKLFLAYVFGFFSLAGIGLFLFPRPLSPAYRIWLTIAHLIGRIVGVLFLTLGYYLVITPFAFVKRLFGGRPLPMRPNHNVSSYWVQRSEPVQSKERFKKRF